MSYESLSQLRFLDNSRVIECSASLEVVLFHCLPKSCKTHKKQLTQEAATSMFGNSLRPLITQRNSFWSNIYLFEDMISCEHPEAEDPEFLAKLGLELLHVIVEYPRSRRNVNMTHPRRFPVYGRILCFFVLKIAHNIRPPLISKSLLWYHNLRSLSLEKS